VSLVYSAGGRFRCDPKTGVIEERVVKSSWDVVADAWVKLPPVPRNWRDPRVDRRKKPQNKIKTWTEENKLYHFEGGY
jgi:hypothetical protein